MTLPDPNDRHVVVAAVRGRADVIVTGNVRHCPLAILGRSISRSSIPTTSCSISWTSSRESCSRFYESKLLTLGARL